MKQFEIELNKVYPNIVSELFTAKLSCYVSEYPKEGNFEYLRPAVLVLPGGAYHWVSDREAEPIALSFVSRGCNAYVLTYSTRNFTDAVFPTQTLQTYMAINYIRENAETHYTNKNKVLVAGFSAGGHLAATSGYMYNNRLVKNLFPDSSLIKPDGLILGYPVVSAYINPHIASIKNIYHEGLENKDILSVEKNITKDMPKTFLWHCKDDNVVDFQNAVVYANAMKKCGAKYKFMLLESGGHGLSLATKYTAASASGINKKAAKWLEKAIQYFDLP